MSREVEEFLALARRLSPSTLETYRRDLTKYVLPTHGAYRLGAIPPDQIENWLNDEMDPTATVTGPSSTLPWTRRHVSAGTALVAARF